MSKLQEKIQSVRGERELNFGNEIIEILVLPALLEMETNCGNGIAENGGKKNATSTIFFTTNFKWLVIIGSNLNLTIRLLFCPNNNN